MKLIRLLNLVLFLIFLFFMYHIYQIYREEGMRRATENAKIEKAVEESFALRKKNFYLTQKDAPLRQKERKETIEEGNPEENKQEILKEQLEEKMENTIVSTWNTLTEKTDSVEKKEKKVSKK